MREVPLSRGRYTALVDDEDYELVVAYSWQRRRFRPANVFYATRDIVRGHQRQRMHTLIMGMAGIDHINHDGLDNRRSNLRVADQSQNTANARKWTVETSSPYKGVYWDVARSRWHAQIVVHRHRRFLGRFIDEDEAARAYDRAAREHFGEFAYLNFPDPGERGMFPDGPPER